MKLPYTYEQIDWLFNNYETYNSYRDIRNDFNIRFNTNKSVNAIQQYMTKSLKIRLVTSKTEAHYTEEQEKWLTDNYKDFSSYEELTTAFNRTFRRTKPIRSIREKCSKRLGLTGIGNPGRFQTGHVQEQCPIGTIRKCSNGCSYIKVIDNQYSYISGYSEPYWLPVQKKVWQDHYGEVPEGKMIIFLDGNRDNLDIENLYCIDRKISAIMAKNKWYTMSSEHTLTAIKWCELHYAMKGEQTMYNKAMIFGGYGITTTEVKPTPEDRPYDNFHMLELGIKKSFEEVVDLNVSLFTTSVENLYDIFLANLPEEGRQHYNCNACRNFVNRYGNIVYVSGGMLFPAMWNFKCPDFFEQAYYAVRKAVSNSKITGVFIPESKKLGISRTGEWTHMHVEVPKKIIYKNKLKTADQEAAEKKEDFRMLMRALHNYKLSTVETAVNLLRSNTLYRGEKTLGIAEWFLEVKKLFDASYRFPDNKINLIWVKVATAPVGFCHISSSMIGTLLDDIEAGYDYNDIKRRFDVKMNPLKYQRPQAAPSAGNVKRAEEIIAKLGLENSLKRRYARLDEIPTIWKPRSSVNDVTSTGVFAGIKTKESLQNKEHEIVPRTTKMTWEKFHRTVLPLAKKIEFVTKFGNDSYAAIVTAEYPDAPPIILWDNDDTRNPFSWYLYSGGSPASRWGLLCSVCVEVTGITYQPNMWTIHENYGGQGVFFILKGCKDINGSSSLALFPEVLRRDLREVRSTIEAYSLMHKLAGGEFASACGILLQDSNHNWNCRLRVTTDVGVSEYILDRWD